MEQVCTERQRENYRGYEYVIYELKYPVGFSGLIVKGGVFKYGVEIKKGEAVVDGAIVGSNLTAERLAKHIIEGLH